MSIAQNTALFALLGTTYGGDGVQTFALPDLRGRVAIHQGQGAGLTPYTEGQRAGTENVTLLANQMPIHNHLIGTNSAAGSATRPANNLLAAATSGNIYAPAPGDGSTLNPSAVGNAGGNQPLSIIQPYLCVIFIIALNGIFPSRN
jgi:microcystin-dependent protein